MKTTFTTIVWKDKEMNATALEVPADAVAALGTGKRHPVKVSLKGYISNHDCGSGRGVYVAAERSE